MLRMKFFTNCCTARCFRLHIIKLDTISNAKQRLFLTFLYEREAGIACDKFMSNDSGRPIIGLRLLLANQITRLNNREIFYLGF